MGMVEQEDAGVAVVSSERSCKQHAREMQVTTRVMLHVVGGLL